MSVAALLSASPYARGVELGAYDRRLSLTAQPAAPADSVVLVTIDDDSLRRMEPIVGRWPWPRVVHATLVDYLARAPARVIGYDVLFPEADRGRFMYGDTEWTGEESDRALVDAASRAGTVVFAVEAASAGLLDPSKAVDPSVDGVPALNQAFDAGPCLEPRPALTPPFPALAAAALGLGHSFVPLDGGVLREMAPFIRVGGRTVPSLPVAVAMAAMRADPASVHPSARGLTVAGAPVPLIEQTLPDYYGADVTVCRALVPYRGPVLNAAGQPTFRSYSFYDLFYSEQQLLSGEAPLVDPAALADRIVMVGVSAQGLHEVFAVPFAEGEMTGAEIHANVVDGLLSHRAIAPADTSTVVTVLAVPTLIVSLVGAFAPAWITALAGAAVGVVVWLVSVALFRHGIWAPVVLPLLGVALVCVGDLAWQYFVEGREKRRVKALFSRFVARDVFEQLMADPSRAALGGSRRMMTVLFSDVRGFTSFSEQGAPEDVVRQLNEYFSCMVGVLFAHHGTLDKFVGDMVMALFGAPMDDDSHAEHAVQAALAMSKALDDLNARWAVEGRPTLDIGIGINTGEMVAGNIGAETIMSYTVIGDAVNLGARLESLNKDYGSRVIISEATRTRLEGQYDIRPLGEVTVKGRSRPVAIYEVKA